MEGSLDVQGSKYAQASKEQKMCTVKVLILGHVNVPNSALNVLVKF